MSICVWSGASGRPQIIDGGQLRGDTAPVAGDSLVFDAATPIAVNNDLPAGIELDAIDINPGSGGSITITGNSFALPDGGTISSGFGLRDDRRRYHPGAGAFAVVNPGCA